MSINTDAAKLLRHAVELIEEYGWVQGQYGSYDTGFCATGAIGHDAWKNYRNYRKVVDRAMGTLSAHLNVPESGSSYTRWGGLRSPGRVIPLWNDSPRTTKDIVVAEMRTVADLLESGKVMTL